MTLQNFKLILAPMAGYTDRTFRMLCRAHGCDLAVTEMISAKGLYYGSARTGALLRIAPDEAPVIVQIFGRDPAIMAGIAARIADENGCAVAAIDINMGCPAPKITKNGEGSALMKEPQLAGAIIGAVTKAVQIPVTVKLRKGWDDAHVNAVELAKIAEDAGAAAVTVHGRTRAQMYTGNADCAIIAAVKQAVHIPVIGNGDIQSGDDMLAMREKTDVDGVMIGRGALGNPWIFEECRAALSGTLYTPPDAAARRAAAIEHAELAIRDKGPHAMLEMRKHLPFYLRGTRNAAKMRAALASCESIEELRAVWS